MKIGKDRFGRCLSCGLKEYHAENCATKSPEAAKTYRKVLRMMKKHDAAELEHQRIAKVAELIREDRDWVQKLHRHGAGSLQDLVDFRTRFKLVYDLRVDETVLSEALKSAFEYLLNTDGYHVPTRLLTATEECYGIPPAKTAGVETKPQGKKTNARKEGRQTPK